MSSVLVTGAAGFLGYYIARTLAHDSSNYVFCVDNFSRGEDDQLYRSLIERENVKHLELDLSDTAALAELPNGLDFVYHMAALNGTQNFYERPFEVVRSCTLPTLNLLFKYGRNGRCGRFVYAGTSEAYASTVTHFGWEVPTAENVPLSIDDPFNARWSYGGSKMHGEIATINASKSYGLPFTIVRYHNAYGPRMGDKHVIPDFLKRARSGCYELFGYEDTRSFIYGQDAADATIMLASSPLASGEIVNVGGDLELSMKELALRMMDIANINGELLLHPSPKGSVKRRAPKLDKLRQITGYEPKWSLEEGLKRTIEFYLHDSQSL